MKKCPVCNKQLDKNKNHDSSPFCSERCRLIDLGDWLTENHKISEENIEPMLDELDIGNLTKH